MVPSVLLYSLDADYLKFLDSLQNPETEDVMSMDTYLEKLEAKEREAKGTHIRARSAQFD